ncbi:sulfatase family protein [Planomonospora parontospora]|uniref:sulfatase family protein n=1 Tax=Planomonospora parontospora TaxID=58119 RepID=UPI00194334D0|nr:sulfatase [Planomonospora parontospora]GGL44316.1 sulfatase [Planomonospora parontospora subsp. antibiotica]GII18608.1 sulfatase [Planomonospora parontospora subsp. antibiotica]
MLNAARKALCLFPLLILVSAAVPAAAEAPRRPNVVLILVDDLGMGDLEKFPNIWNEFVRSGAGFSRFFVPNSWCCPSRASILRSQYVHSHGVLTNTLPKGGFGRFYRKGLERSTMGTWMKNAGYRTGLMGKYLNHYPGPAPATHVPRGWDEWHVPVRRLYDEYGYTLNENGRLRAYGSAPEDYLTDVLSAKADAFVSRGDDPFFLYLAPVAPHLPANHALRHRDAFTGHTAPRPPSFDQEDVAAEPLWLRSRKRLTPERIERTDEIYRDRLRAMLGVDDMVGSLVRSLRAAGKLDDTYLFFGSDNGFHLGQHRLGQGKTTPFDESIKVPMFVRGPGIQPGRTVTEVASTVDLAPTFAGLAGARLPGFVEGRSLLPLLQGRTPIGWRRNVLVEFHRPGKAKPSAPARIPAYQAMRTAGHTFVRYATGEYQLYDLASDPYQLRNLAERVPRSVIDRFEHQLDALVACSGASCRIADAASPPEFAVPFPEFTVPFPEVGGSVLPRSAR